ncbi:MAG: DRTGG domain-containing protein [Chloroflexi bacterium]|nr:DRTGG domain-containing protein [Chloroflexota bacterium]
MAILYVAGQRPGVGSTSVVAALATVWKKAGQRVAVVKPATLNADGDAAFYAKAFGSPSDASTVVAEHDQDELVEEASKRVDALAADHDMVIIEGLPLFDADGYAVAASPALAEHLGARVLGVVPYDRSLNATDAAKWHDTYASLLSGVVINRRAQYGQHDASTRLAPAFEDAGVSVYGILPEDRRLLAPTVGQVATLLSGTFYAGASGQHDLIESFLIGGLITEWGGNYFGRHPNQAVIVRGGRTDIQMSALNFPLKCLLLTGCDTPPQYVYQRANDLDVPLVTSNHDTPAATALLERLEAQVTIDHPDKIERVAEMVSDAVDLLAISESAGLRSD